VTRRQIAPAQSSRAQLRAGLRCRESFPPGLGCPHVAPPPRVIGSRQHDCLRRGRVRRRGLPQIGARAQSSGSMTSWVLSAARLRGRHRSRAPAPDVVRIWVRVSRNSRAKRSGAAVRLAAHQVSMRSAWRLARLASLRFTFAYEFFCKGKSINEFAVFNVGSSCFDRFNDL